MVGEYIAQGFNWFVFDVVSLDQEPKTNLPIQYRFKTRKLFYPLKITSLAEGETSIEILAFVSRNTTWHWGTPELASATWLQNAEHEIIWLKPTDLPWINGEMDALLEGQPARLEVWQLEGSLRSFDQDLVLHAYQASGAD
jgi:hypothetical protein